jgi:hypothetical protein
VTDETGCNRNDKAKEDEKENLMRRLENTRLFSEKQISFKILCSF